MNIIELLKRALEWQDPYEDMPDYAAVLEHLGLDADEDPEVVREAVALEIEAMDAESDAAAPDGDAHE